MQLRSGTLPLAFEIGRYEGDVILMSLRINLMFHCLMYRDLRQHLLEKAQLKNLDLFWLSACEYIEMVL